MNNRNGGDVTIIHGGANSIIQALIEKIGGGESSSRQVKTHSRRQYVAFVTGQ